jgi:hypothetical protein
MLGNLYIRQGRLAEAGEALAQSASTNPEMAPLAIRTVWAASDGDVGLARRVAGESELGRAALVAFFTGNGRLDEALDAWRSLERDYAGSPVVADHGTQLADALLRTGRGADAADMWSALAPDLAPAIGALRGGDFEQFVYETAPSPFAWSVTQSPQARVSVGDGRTGRGLRVDYDATGNASLQHAAQIVRVVPGASYTLSWWAAATDLRSGGLPAVLVLDPGTQGKALARQALPGGTREWEPARVSFVAPASGVVSVAVSREACGPVCPIFGTVRLDDFHLER